MLPMLSSQYLQMYVDRAFCVVDGVVAQVEFHVATASRSTLIEMLIVNIEPHLA